MLGSFEVVLGGQDFILYVPLFRRLDRSHSASKELRVNEINVQSNSSLSEELKEVAATSPRYCSVLGSALSPYHYPQ
jgi:hypothetical protein